MTFQVTIMFGLGFVAAILNCVGLFLLLQIDWNIVDGFFGSHLKFEFQTLLFRLKILEMRSPH